MCGIAGFTLLGRGIDQPDHVLRAMSDAILPRGPDSFGLWSDLGAGVALGHRRLAIVDLTDAGHQPMTSASERYVIVYNGEIYNANAVRQQLPVQSWRGHSDTEVLLAAIEQWGLAPALAQLRGMFAFALWDRHTNTLSLARDRLGEKPLYYAQTAGGLVFGSELKALRAHPLLANPVIDRNALALYLRHNSIPAPYSIYENVFKLPPACIVSWTKVDGLGPIQQYWSAADAVRKGKARPFPGGEREAVDELEMLLRDAVAEQMMSDVPLGAFLSGGIDSSTIVSMMQAQAGSRTRTFTIGFDVPGFNEAEHAKAVADHLGTLHTELYITPRDALAVVPALPSIYDEPFADSSQIPTYLVSKMAREHVTVAMSGDAGDELFGGYSRYLQTDALASLLMKIPASLRSVLAGAIRGAPISFIDAVSRVGGVIVPSLRGQSMVGDKAHKIAGLLSCPNHAALYKRMVSQWPEPECVIRGAKEPATILDEAGWGLPFDNEIERMMYVDMLGYLPTDILAKVDRAAMAVSLETRTPLLDQRIVEFAWSLPFSMKIRGAQQKYLLRQVLYRHVPPRLIDRPKQGFAVPIGHWLRGELREWAELLLDPARIRQEGYFDERIVTQIWQEHLRGRRNWQHRLWTLLMFQSWLETNHGAAGNRIAQ